MNERKLFTVRMTMEELRQLAEVADLYGMSKSETVRVAVKWLRDNQPPIFQAPIIPRKPPKGD